MLQKIIFQDNLYYITRSLDIIQSGLHLDLSDEIFTEKIIADILFFDSALQKLFNRIEPQPHLPDYADIMHCLYFCTAKYISLLQFLCDKKSETESVFKDQFERFEGIEKKHQSLIDKIKLNITDKEIQNDSYAIVSQMELSELLNF